VKFEVKIPTVGESISEATIGQWMKKNGEAVKRNDVLLSIETDKASVEVVSEQDGVLFIAAETGKVLPIGAVVGHIDNEAKASVSATAPAASAPAAPMPAASAPAGASKSSNAGSAPNTHLSPAVQKIVTEKGLDPQALGPGSGRDGRLTKGDVMNAGNNPAAVTPISSAKPAAPAPVVSMELRGPSKQGEQKRVPMTTIRKRISERLVHSQQTTATLTTFNEIDMTKINEIRAKYKDKFKEKYGVSLGVMGIFVKAAVEALKAWPPVNAYIDGTDLIYNNYFNIGVAVSTEKGLIVPVIRDADQMSVAQIELAIRGFANKARDGKISIDDLSGGTFTVSNGGVFGSLMSTPILNPPQSGILGMHKVEDRPVVVNGQIVIRPMMYVALSYDHRIIDGKEAVGFLVKIKEGVEDPERLLLEI
jgi:2-oxoglutarate dehydrogenase E2 component (dihydrolipoamide succinyltransferase)